MPHPNRAVILKLDPSDNVVVARSTIAAGTILEIDGQNLRLANDIELGHKIACTSIPLGAKVMKYGAPIGSATADIAPGDHVHSHNLQSDYVAFHAHDEANGKGDAA